MADEQNPENPETPPQQGALSQPPVVQPPVPQAPVIPDWIKARTDNCADEGCDSKIDPLNALVDESTGKKYCNSHAQPCEECNTVHPIDDMHQYNKRYGHKEWYCDNCFSDKFISCPNCNEVVDKDAYLAPTYRNTRSMKQGGCKVCSIECYGCEKIIDKDYTYPADDHEYCEDCYSEYFTTCEECNDTIDRDSANYVEDVGDFCNTCYNDKFVTCESCEKTIDKEDALELDKEYYCEDCYQKIAPTNYKEYTQNFEDFSYTKKDKYLNILAKIVPISIKDLKTKYPSMANGLNDLIVFGKGKPLTLELIQQYRATLNPEEFPVEYTAWAGLQRSVDKLEQNPIDKPQLVINVLPSNEMLDKLKTNPAIYDLFDKINTLSKQSTHPYVKDQIGWIRLELDPNGEYILVDEIQSDHSNASLKLKNHENNLDIKKIRSSLKNKYNLDDESLDKLLIEYATILKDFPNIATEAVNKFARKNNFKKIYWHTYESGKKLKDNEPPKSLYEKVPKENFFLPSQNKPFGLEGEFFEKDAKKAKTLYKLARKLYFRNVLNNIKV